MEVESWVGIAKQALVVFRSCLAFDIVRNRVVTKTRDDCEEACLRWPFLGVAIHPDKACLKALGMVDMADQPCELQPVIVVAAVGMESRLT